MTDLEINETINRATQTPRALNERELQGLLTLKGESLKKLFQAAYAVKVRYCGKRVAIRGIIEAGNVCSKNCYYCGIRRGNHSLGRYQLSEDEIVHLAELNAAENYASLVIQSGEIESNEHTDFIERVLRRIAPLNLGVTLSLGEQKEEVYRRWKDAGASRYLLRIETSNPKLYHTLHPADHNWERRVECLRALRRLGYQVGTGVMSALPGQSVEDLARDILFFGELDVDMIGMGPYIPHPDTPMGKAGMDAELSNTERLEIGLKMIAVTRLYLHDVNIAAATALQALADNGREQGILAGANVIMPNITETKYRRRYQLYSGKPNLDENAESVRKELEQRLAKMGESISYGERGDSHHFKQRQKEMETLIDL